MSTLSKKYSRERSRHFIRLKITWDIIRRTCVGRLLNRWWWWWSVTCWVPQVGKTKGNCRFSATTTTTISSIIKWSQGELLFHYLLPFRGQLLNTELLILIKISFTFSSIIASHTVPTFTWRRDKMIGNYSFEFIYHCRLLIFTIYPLFDLINALDVFYLPISTLRWITDPQVLLSTVCTRRMNNLTKLDTFISSTWGTFVRATCSTARFDHDCGQRTDFVAGWLVFV